MKTSQKGINLIKNCEGFYSKAYLCPAGVPTIGYGTTHYPNGRKVKLRDPCLTKLKAEEFLCYQLKYYEDAVGVYTYQNLRQEQFDALISFTYNLGINALKKSTLLKKINRNPNDPSIAYEFKKWIRTGNRILKGLQIRREKESELYFS